jgi:hypothetical protein
MAYIAETIVNISRRKVILTVKLRILSKAIRAAIDARTFTIVKDRYFHLTINAKGERISKVWFVGGNVNGRKHEYTYKKVDDRMERYEGTKLQCTTAYRNGRKHGSHIFYYDNGPSVRSVYDDGMKMVEVMDTPSLELSFI